MDSEDKIIGHSKDPEVLKRGYNPVIDRSSSQSMLPYFDALGS